MQEKSRILVFTTAFRPMVGGSEIALEEITRRLPDIFFDVITPWIRKDFIKKERNDNICIHRVGIGVEIIDKLIFPVSGFIKAIRLLMRNNYSKSHAYQASYGGGAAWILKLFHPRLPFVLTLQEGKDLTKQNILIRFFRDLIIQKADVITAISRYLAEYARKINPKAEILVIPNGVDLNKFKVQNEELKTTDQNTKVFITVSRLVEKNGVGDLIDSFKILNTEYNIKNTKLLIVGDGPLRKDLELRITNCELRNYIKIIGEVSPEEVPQYLMQADVFVRPSLSEGLGSAFLEAMATGIPVIGTPVGGIKDFLIDNETGLFCRVGDPKDIAEKMRIILFDDDLRQKLILNSRKLVEEKYTWEKIAAKFRDIYINATI